jgi:hypothetical protein
MEISIGSIPLEKESKEAERVLEKFLTEKGYEVIPFRKPAGIPFTKYVNGLFAEALIFDLEDGLVEAVFNTIKEKPSAFTKPILFLHNSSSSALPRIIGSQVRFLRYGNVDQAKLNVIHFLKEKGLWIEK